MNIVNLLKLCDRFLKKANLESDMAKRIMLSVIPELMHPLEKSNVLMDPAYWGVDIRALSSAVNGVKDLIKYGTLACAEEINYYHAKQETNYNHKITALARENRYLEALSLAEKIFMDLEHWAIGYGRERWARIAHILYQLEEKRQFLELVQTEARSGQRDPKTNYEKLAIETMKEIIVLMNVFDGLAHNGGNIMPKLLYEERREDDDYDGKTLERVERMMDAKELNNPINTFKEIEHVMDQSPQRQQYKDWISKARRHPDYQYIGEDERKKQMAYIRVKKSFKPYISEMEIKFSQLSNIKDRILNAHNEITKKQLMRNFAEELYNLKDQSVNMGSSARGKTYYLKPGEPLLNFYNQINEVTAHLSQLLNEIRLKVNSAYPSSIYDYQHGTYDEHDMMSDLKKIRAAINNIDTVISFV